MGVQGSGGAAAGVAAAEGPRGGPGCAGDAAADGCRGSARVWERRAAWWCVGHAHGVEVMVMMTTCGIVVVVVFPHAWALLVVHASLSCCCVVLDHNR